MQLVTLKMTLYRDIFCKFRPPIIIVIVPSSRLILFFDFFSDSHAHNTAMKPTSPDTIASIKVRISRGESSRQIASSLGVSKSTVNKIRGSLGQDTPRPKAGQKPKLSDRDKTQVASLIRRGEARTATEAAKIFNQDLPEDKRVCAQTVRRALVAKRLECRNNKKRPALKPSHRRARLAWAQEHREWTVDDWKRVVWSDETKVNRICSDGVQYGWVEVGDALSDRAVTETVKFGGGSVMVWGCMSWLGAGILHKVVGRMDSHQYIDILKAGLLPTIENIGRDPELPPPDQLIFQQDNDPKHTAGITKAWFEEEGIKTLKWPAQSPDLNPIEHLWAHLKRKLGEYRESPGGVHDLWHRLKEEWVKIPKEVCQSLIESMPRRIGAVIKAKGGHTKY